MTGPQGRILREENSRTALTALAGPADDESSSNSSCDSSAERSSTTTQYFAAILATLSAFSAGTILGWSSPALPLLQAENSPLPVTADEGSWLGSLLTLGALLGAAPAGALSQLFGRQRFLAFLSLPLLTSWLMVALGRSVGVLYVGRFIGGLATGAVSVAAPVYCAEIAEQKCRGALGTLFQLQLVVGILFAYVIGAWAPLECFAFTCALVPAVFAITFAWMPETPQFLLSRGRKFAAENSLQWLRGKGCDVQKELLILQSAAQEADASDAGSARRTLLTLASDAATRRALLVSLGLMAFQQLSGINAVVFYSGSIFKEAGGALSPGVASVVIAGVMVLATLCATMMVDKAGRKPLLLLSAAAMAVCLAALSFSFAYTVDAGEEKPDWLNWLPVLSVAIYIVVFSIGFGPIPWMMMGELFSASAKSPASALVASFNWALAFAVTKGFQSLVAALGSAGAFAFFSGVCMVGCSFVVLIVPETKGRSIEQIQQQLAAPKRTLPV
ncbi:facilitated trehalose transporter Tret1-like [Neocloeon triangulifer]|uniref:facilitated trehalose transporter Tret1-like n=1 Tax=Neocloeon triangulifer TaxID=2078957 RepID=UPI00286F0865|nr:facilitated trehalose transporter Tret1-like [Neocloeon triangulifer]